MELLSLENINWWHVTWAVNSIAFGFMFIHQAEVVGKVEAPSSFRVRLFVAVILLVFGPLIWALSSLCTPDKKRGN